MQIEDVDEIEPKIREGFRAGGFEIIRAEISAAPVEQPTADCAGFGRDEKIRAAVAGEKIGQGPPEPSARHCGRSSCGRCRSD